MAIVIISIAHWHLSPVFCLESNKYPDPVTWYESGTDHMVRNCNLDVISSCVGVCVGVIEHVFFLSKRQNSTDALNMGCHVSLQ